MLRVNAINRQELLKRLTFHPKSLVFKTVSVPCHFFDYILNPDEQDKGIDNDDILQYRDVEIDEAQSGMSIICIDLGVAPRQDKEPERN